MPIVKNSTIIEITIDEILKAVHIQKEQLRANVTDIIKSSGLCFAMFKDPEVGRDVCSLKRGHKGPHKCSQGYIEFTEGKPFDPLAW